MPLCPDAKMERRPFYDILCELPRSLRILVRTGTVECKKKSATTEKPYDNREQVFVEETEGHDSLLIGAFNLRKFGVPKVQNGSVLDVLVKIVTRYDVIAVSEITDRTEKAIKTLMAQVNFVSDHPYNYVVSSRVGRTNNKEQYGIIYRPERVQITNHLVYDDSLSDPFTREPQIAEIRVKDQDKIFALVNIHVKPSDAVKEIDALVEVQEWIESSLKIKDTVIVGDLNADCTYVPKKSWKTIRLRTMERFIWLLGDEVDSTVGKTDCAYDRIIMSGNYWHNSIISGSAQPFRFDEAYGLNEQGALGVSDHYPVEFRLKIGTLAPQAVSSVERQSQTNFKTMLPLLSVMYELFHNLF